MDHERTHIRSVESVGPDAVAITIETPPDFDAAPGEFVSLSLPEVDESRYYTISSPAIGESFEVTISIDPEGTLAPTLADCAAGDAIDVGGPFGEASYDSERQPLVLAGGPGVGPAVAIAERALTEGADPEIVYRSNAPIHRDRLDDLAEQGVPVTILDAAETLRRPVADALASDPDVVFVYGFAPFVEDVRAAIAAAEDEPGDIRVESFG